MADVLQTPTQPAAMQCNVLVGSSLRLVGILENGLKGENVAWHLSRKQEHIIYTHPFCIFLGFCLNCKVLNCALYMYRRELFLLRIFYSMDGKGERLRKAKLNVKPSTLFLLQVNFRAILFSNKEQNCHSTLRTRFWEKWGDLLLIMYDRCSDWMLCQLQLPKSSCEHSFRSLSFAQYVYLCVCVIMRKEAALRWQGTNLAFLHRDTVRLLRFSFHYIFNACVSHELLTYT